jgi:hypothetical protein
MKHIFIALALLLVGCSMCGNDPINAEVSPGGNHVAIAFIRNCGATTPFYTHVSILDKTGKLPNEAGNIFIVEGKQPLTVEWIGGEQIKIGGIGSGKRSLKLSEYQGVRISYE